MAGSYQSHINHAKIVLKSLLCKALGEENGMVMKEANSGYLVSYQLPSNSPNVVIVYSGTALLQPPMGQTYLAVI